LYGFAFKVHCFVLFFFVLGPHLLVDVSCSVFL